MEQTDLEKATENLWSEFLKTGLGRFVIWCVEQLDRLITSK
jgi:hypothetical protein